MDQARIVDSPVDLSESGRIHRLFFQADQPDAISHDVGVESQRADVFGSTQGLDA
jgi:hypothetical protein